MRCGVGEGSFDVAFCLAMVCVLPTSATAQKAPTDSDRIERLVSLGRLWGTIKYVHPSLGSDRIDWDSALVSAIPRVRAAETPTAFASAVQQMLDALDDPVTQVVKPGVPARSSPGDHDPQGSRLGGDTWLLSFHHYADLQDFDTIERLQAQFDSLKASRAVIIDLRTDATGDDPTAMSLLQFAGLDRVLASRPIRSPAQRGRYQSGFVPPAGITQGYTTGFYTESGDRIEPLDSAPAKPIVFIVNQQSLLPPMALALQDAGLAWIVAEGKVSDAVAVSKMFVTLADSVQVTVRTTELVHSDGSTGFEPDTVVRPSSGRDGALQVALALTHTPSHTSARTLAPPPLGPPPDQAYAATSYPPLPYRLLAAYRIWALMEFFYPYRALMGEEPLAVLRAFVPRLEAARDSLDYTLTVAEMWTHIHDSHGFIRSPVMDAYRGPARPPVRLRSIQGRPVVTELSPDSVARPLGIRVGDVIETVDGEPAQTRLARLRRVTPASTPQALERDVANLLLRGPDSSRVRVSVRGADGRTRRITLPRDRRYQPYGTRSGPIIRRYPGGIGYADLDRLTIPMVDSMFDQLADTRAIVLDMRGYPNGTAWSIAPRLTDRDHLPVARFTRMQPMLRDTADRTYYTFVQTLPSATGWRYRGRTIMLIDERTQSQAEHSGLFFRTAGGTAFIGSPTAGANGDVVALSVPGGISLSFSGQAVTWMDGSQLQRVGLRPDVTIRPTIAGVRAGRDEVLEGALAWIRARHYPPAGKKR